MKPRAQIARVASAVFSALLAICLFAFQAESAERRGDQDNEIYRLRSSGGRALELGERARTALIKGQFPFEAHFVDQASNECTVTPQDIKNYFETALSGQGTVLNAVSRLASKPMDTIAKSNLVVVIDSFGALASRFRSYHLSKSAEDSRSFVYLDCQPLSLAHWDALLAHELVHVVFAEARLETWFEEGLAQLLEHEFYLHRRLGNVEALLKRSEFPLLFDNARPLSSSDSYALSFLFASYIHHHGGGWSILKAMAESGTDPRYESCRSSVFYEQILCAGRDWLNRENDSSPLLEKLTRKGLLRHLAVSIAAEMKDSSDLYHHPHVSGSRPARTSVAKAVRVLKPGQFTVMDFQRRRWNPNLEIYRVLSNGRTYRILPYSVDPNSFELKRDELAQAVGLSTLHLADRLVILNLTASDQDW